MLMRDGVTVVQRCRSNWRVYSGVAHLVGDKGYRGVDNVYFQQFTAILLIVDYIRERIVCSQDSLLQQFSSRTPYSAENHDNIVQ